MEGGEKLIPDFFERAQKFQGEMPMKKVLLALTLVAMLATSASADSFLGGRWGLGAEFTPFDNTADVTQNVDAFGDTWIFAPSRAPQLEPFISYDPDMLPALQLRLAIYTGQGKLDAVNQLDNAETEVVNSSLTNVALSGLYRLWSGDVVPYVGLKIGVLNQYIPPLSYFNYWWSGADGSPWMNYNTVYGKVLVGAEWKLAKSASLFLNWDLLTGSTTTWTTNFPDLDPEILTSDGKFFGNASVGLVLYLN
jgi:hypothetical protein